MVTSLPALPRCLEQILVIVIPAPHVRCPGRELLGTHGRDHRCDPAPGTPRYSPRPGRNPPSASRLSLYWVYTFTKNSLLPLTHITGLVFQNDRLPRHPPFLDSLPDQRLLPREFSLSLLHFDKHDADRIDLLVLRIRVTVKDNKIDRVADEPGIGRGEGELRQERGHLLGDPALQRGPRAVDGILPDLTCAFEFPVFEIVSRPLFDHGDPLPEEEVCSENAEKEGG